MPPPTPENLQLLAEIDRDKLGTLIVNLLRDDIRDREAFSWNLMREYDIRAYEGLKGKATEPWFNASNFPVPLTPTLLDTGHAHVVQSIWSDPNKVVRVRGIGPEDERTAGSLESLLNWQVINDIDNAYDVVDKTVHRAFKHGNGAIKVIHGSVSAQQKPKVAWHQVPIENLFLRVNSRGAQPHQTDHIFELIPLSENEWELRKSLTNPDGTPFYDGIDTLAKGNTISATTAIGTIMQTQDIASGTSLGQMYSRDYRYILECYLTYVHKTEEDGKPTILELIVWMSPSDKKIYKLALNTDYDEDTDEYVRPYSVKWVPYPKEDRIYGESLPWIIKPIQEELDYAHNQNMNAAEISIKPPKFYRAGSGFDPEVYETTPDSWHPVANPTQDIFIPTFNVNPIFERQEDKYWELAERRTGFTELFQGRSPDIRQTATYTVARENKSETRFRTIYNRLEQGFAELIHLTYFYDKKYMPEEVKVKVLGYADYKSISELFPSGIRGRYNFFFASNTTVEQQIKKQDTEAFYSQAVLNPIVANSAANLWRMLDMLAESYGIRNLDNWIQKPPEAEILSPDEALRRIVSGQYDVVPDPNIDAGAYLTKIGMFMRTDTYVKGTPEIKMATNLLLSRVKAIHRGQMLAIQDAQLIREMQMVEAQMQAQALEPQANGGQPTNGIR